MKVLLIVTAGIELGAAAALLGFPSTAAELLLGEPLLAPGATILARVGGAGLLSLAVACCFAGGDSQSRAARGLVAAMLLYNLAVAGLLTFAGVGLGLQGIILWPGVILHAAMAAWCIAALRRSG